MARVIETHLSQKLKLMINTIYENGDITTDAFEKEDIIENLRYALNGDIAVVSGRLDKISFTKKNVKHVYSSIDDVKSYFDEDVTLQSISLDCSEQYHSKVINVPVREILEFKPDGDVVKRMSVGLKYGVHMEVELSDNGLNEFDLFEGSIYQQFIYLDLDNGVDKNVTAKIVAITSDSMLTPQKVVFIEDGSVKEIDIKLVKFADKEIPVTQMSATAIEEAITSSESGIVNLPTGDVSGKINITKDVEILGSNPDIKVNTVAFKGKDTGTVFSGSFNIAENVNDSLKGITLTKEAYLNLTSGAGTVSLENCVIKDIEPYQEKSYLCLARGNEPVKLVIEGCYFGTNVTSEVGSYYNGMELVQKLTDGSSISNNYFEESVCSNNIINIYDVEDNANIYIRDNVFEYSSNAVRVGTKGDAKCNIYIENNVYYKTNEEYPEYAGILLVQPYGAATTNMSNVNIMLSGNKHKDKLQLYYLYDGGQPMVFTEENKPNIVVS